MSECASEHVRARASATTLGVVSRDQARVISPSRDEKWINTDSQEDTQLHKNTVTNILCLLIVDHEHRCVGWGSVTGLLTRNSMECCAQTNTHTHTQVHTHIHVHTEIGAQTTA
jgi:hypothetical protein